MFIAEKPELAKAVVEGLGGGKKERTHYTCAGGDVVTWCYGHLLSLSDPEDHDENARIWNLEALPLSWPVRFKPIKKTQPQLNAILSLIKKATLIVNTGDPDEAGQMLIDEILIYANNQKPVKRLLINDNNILVVKKALANMRDNAEFKPLFDSGLARAIADQRYGYNLTRAYTLKAQSTSGTNQVMSVGRVQTTILGLVVNRERQNKSHKAIYYFELEAVQSHKSGTIKGSFVIPENAPVDEEGRISDKSWLQRIKADISRAAGKVVRVDSQHKEIQPPLPFSLLKLQIAVNKHFGFSADKTLQITQELREKYRLITYNRSDSQFLSEEQHAVSPRVLAAIASTAPGLAKAVEVSDATIVSRAFNSKKVTAHHAIIPTEATCKWESLPGDLQKVYLLIARQYLAQFMSPYRYKETIVETAYGPHRFRASRHQPISEGWRRIFSEIKRKKLEDNADYDGISHDDQVVMKELQISDCKTKPKPLYTLSTLLLDLTRVARYVQDPDLKKALLERDKGKDDEQGGIGTPATRSSIIKGLFDRSFLAMKAKNIVATDLGHAFYDLLPSTATSPDMTAIWQQSLAEIQAGKLSPKTYLQSVDKFIAEEVSRVKSSTDKIVSALPSVKCLECGADGLKRLPGKHGHFWKCSCSATFNDKNGKPIKKAAAPKKSDEYACKECGKPLVKREAQKKKNTYWWGCSGFPECKKTYFDDKGKPRYE